MGLLSRAFCSNTGFGDLNWPIALPPGMRRLIQEEIIAAIRQAGLDIVSFIPSAELARMIELVEAKSPISAADSDRGFTFGLSHRQAQADS